VHHEPVSQIGKAEGKLWKLPAYLAKIITKKYCILGGVEEEWQKFVPPFKT
jgi:hypothetical protein